MRKLTILDRLAVAINIDTWFWLVAAPDYRRDDGWVLSLGLVPRRDLMPSWEGLETLVAWAFELKLRSPFARYGFHRLKDGTVGFGPHTRSPVALRVWSDAKAIAERSARRAMTGDTGWTKGQLNDELEAYA